MINNDFWARNEASDGILLRETIKKYTLSIFRGILLFGMCFLILQPILNKISVSFMAEKDLYDTTIVVLPKNFSVLNYKVASTIMDYKTSLFNSLWVSTLVAVIQVFMCSLVGYGFSRFQFPFKRFWFFCVILVIIIPPQTISTSLYLHFRFFNIFGHTVNLRGSMLPYLMMCFTCMGLKNGLYIYMIRQYFMAFPFELEEAAYVDGCGTLKTFIRIMLPQAKPILTSCFLFAFVWQWTDGFYSKMFLGNTKLVSTALARIVDSLGAFIQRINGVKTTISVAYSNCILATGTLMIVMPLIFLYLFAQRAFVESISSTGIKM